MALVYIYQRTTDDPMLLKEPTPTRQLVTKIYKDSNSHILLDILDEVKVAFKNKFKKIYH